MSKLPGPTVPSPQLRDPCRRQLKTKVDAMLPAKPNPMPNAMRTGPRLLCQAVYSGAMVTPCPVFTMKVPAVSLSPTSSKPAPST